VKKINDLDADTSAFGQGLSTTPLQMLMAYAAIAMAEVLMNRMLFKTLSIRPAINLSRGR